MTTRNVVYCGKDKKLRGKTAIALPKPGKPELIRIQMDDVNHPHSHGWHTYNSADWKDDPEC